MKPACSFCRQALLICRHDKDTRALLQLYNERVGGKEGDERNRRETGEELERRERLQEKEEKQGRARETGEELETRERLQEKEEKKGRNRKSEWSGEKKNRERKK